MTRETDRGTAVTELVLALPVLVVLLLFVVFAGRLTSAVNDVKTAATDAARAASVRNAAGDAVASAERTAEASLGDRGVSCSSLAVVVDTSRFVDGGSVAVDVTCTVDLADVTLIGVPGSKTISARGVEVVDRFRSGT